MATKKKKSALAEAASRRLSKIGPAPMDVAQMVHYLMHAEERGEVQRVPLEDGTWAWAMQGPDGKPQFLKPTPEMLELLHKYETEGHPGH